MNPTTAPEIVALLRRASAAYYNGGAQILDDETYDALVDRLKELDPASSFLEEIGAPPPEAGAVPLPFPMPSLDKIKPGQDALARFLATPSPAGFTISVKLDGLSALWIPRTRKLYLRGDGLVGQDISALVAKGLAAGSLKGGPSDEVVRGELILSRKRAIDFGTEQPRAWVNGLVHRKEGGTPEELAAVEFLAYELLSPAGLTRDAQFKELERRGYKTPHIATMPRAEESDLAAMFKRAREVYLYDLDGLVVGLNAPPRSESTATRARNPKDCVAFKMPLDDQAAETTVRAVLWAASAQGYFIPRLQFDPVVIGAATIQYCTAHNARLIKEGCLGPGARVVIRRSGDVIPKLDRIVSAAPGGASFPLEGSYEWDATQTHIRASAASTSKEVLVARMGHFLKTLEIPGTGPATAAALVEAGVTGPGLLYKTSPERLSEILGPKTGFALHVNLRAALDAATEQTLMLASSEMPRGVGATKLAALFARDADPRRWRIGTGCEAPPGWTMATLTAFWPALESYEWWRRRELDQILYPKVVARAAAAGAGPPTPSPEGPKMIVCMTGFRDKELEATLTARGHTVAATFTAKVTHLLVPEGPLKESEKTKAARARGVPIMTKAAFVAQYLQAT